MRPQSCSVPSVLRSKMRPPGPGSRTTSPPETVWSLGHQVAMRVVQVVKACSTEQATSKDSVSGSVTGVLGDQSEAVGGLAPHALDIGLHGLEALGLQLVDASSAFCPLGHEAGVLEQPEMPRHRGPADRHGLGDLADGEALRTEQP